MAPTVLSDLSSLQFLSLHSIDMSGSVDDTGIDGLAALEYLNFEECHLYGTLPTSIGQLAALTLLGLALNAISGTIPSEIGLLQSLESFFAYTNQLSGTHPLQLFGLQNVTDFLVDSNLIKSKLPSYIGQWTSVRNLDLGKNSFTGP